jgi:hypothetical protein
MVNSGALTGNRISGAKEDMSQKPKPLKPGSTTVPCILQVRMCKIIIGVSSTTREYRQIISKLRT